MIICSNCNVEMICHRNGVVAVWAFSHARRGDEYRCPRCDNKTVVTNPNSYHLSPLEREREEQLGTLINMD